MSITAYDERLPLVSVLMPVYRTPEKYLREAIESILKQTYRNLEFLIMDDCPWKTSENIVKSYEDKRIRYVKNMMNLGISAARNKLMDMARGEYLAVMDHDDIALPQRLEKEVDLLQQHPEIGVVGTWYETFPRHKIKKHFVCNEQIEQDLMYNCAILHPSAMIRKKVLTDHNIYYESEFSPAEDYALWTSLIGKTKFANIPEVLQRYRVSRCNTSQLQSKQMRESRQKIHERLQREHPLLWSQASKKETFSFLNIPVVKCIHRGLSKKYRYFGLFTITKRDDIIMHDVSSLPVYIISFNRLSYLRLMISMLEKYHLYNIHIIDNASTYPPLLEYLNKTPYKVHRMKENYGHMVFFEEEEFRQIRENEYYILTDPDVIATEDCPKGFLDYFYMLLQKYPQFNKVGFSLKTDDIPDITQAGRLLQKWEKQYYKHRLNYFSPYLYDSALDTTFALYRPQKEWKTRNFYKAIRVGFPYEARHLPWYKDLSIQSDEDLFYVHSDCGSGNWNDENGLNKVRESLLSKAVDNWWEYIYSCKKSARRTIVRVFGIKLTFNKKKT